MEKHTFEIAELGMAPFKIIACREEIFQAHPSAPCKPGGTCAYCGRAITCVFVVDDVKGIKIKIGSSCIKKTGDKGMVDLVKRELRKRQQDKERIRIIEGKNNFQEVKQLLQKEPHPNTYRARLGDTMADWVQWMLENAGHTGMLTATRQIEKLRTRKIEIQTNKDY